MNVLTDEERRELIKQLLAENEVLIAEVERLRAVIEKYEKERLSRLGGIGSPA